MPKQQVRISLLTAPLVSLIDSSLFAASLPRKSLQNQGFPLRKLLSCFVRSSSHENCLGMMAVTHSLYWTMTLCLTEL